MVTRYRRLLPIAVVLSIGIHLEAAVLAMLLPRILPGEAPEQEQGTVELLMVEQKGADPSEAGQRKDTTPAPVAPAALVRPDPAPPDEPDAPKGEHPKEVTATPSSEAASAPLAPETASAPPASEHGDEPVPPPAERTPPNRAEVDTQPAQKPDEESGMPPRSQAASAAAPPRSQQAPVFDLAGTESESNAIVFGARVLPAMRDDRFRNRPPPYPVEAQIRGEHGSVLVVIHVAENGLATGADVEESSGFDLLDRAAVAAVQKWHFRPALKAGRAVPFDMPFRFIFQPY